MPQQMPRNHAQIAQNAYCALLKRRAPKKQMSPSDAHAGPSALEEVAPPPAAAADTKTLSLAGSLSSPGSPSSRLARPKSNFKRASSPTARWQPSTSPVRACSPVRARRRESSERQGNGEQTKLALPVRLASPVQTRSQMSSRSRGSAPKCSSSIGDHESAALPNQTAISTSSNTRDPRLPQGTMEREAVVEASLGEINPKMFTRSQSSEMQAAFHHFSFQRRPSKDVVTKV
jgi:hypothetical protein